MIVRPGAVDQPLELWKERRRTIFYPKTDLLAGIDSLCERKEKIGASAPDEIRRKLSPLIEDEIRAIEFVPRAGTFHAIFRVETVRANWVLKGSATDEPDFGFLIESRAMEQLRARGLPALEIPVFRTIADELPFPFLVMREALGKPLNQFENPDTQAIQQPLLRLLGVALATIHQIAGTGAGLVDPTDPTRGLLLRWEDYLRLRLEEHIGLCREFGAINSIEAVETKERFTEIPEARSAFLHGDPGHHNVFSDGERITALIDWEDALIGDPVFDIAHWGTFVRDEMRDEFLEGYSSAGSVPSDFEFRYWLYYLRVALSKTVHRHRFGVKDRPGRPPASQRIQKALSNLRKL